MSDTTTKPRTSVGSQFSFWLRYSRLEKLQRLAQHYGITRNAMMSRLIDDADEVD